MLPKTMSGLQFVGKSRAVKHTSMSNKVHKEADDVKTAAM